MATKKRVVAGRTAAGRRRTASRTSKARASQAPPVAVTRAKASPASTRTKTRPTPAGARSVARQPDAPSREVAALKARLQRERNAFERRLTEAMQEIGQLRHHEMRATQLERQLQERDALILRLRAELAESRARPHEPVTDRGDQPSLAFGQRVPAPEHVD